MLVGTMGTRLLTAVKVLSGLVVLFYAGSYLYMQATALPYFVRPRAYAEVLRNRLSQPLEDGGLILVTFPSGDPRGAEGISVTSKGKVWLCKYSYSFATGGGGWGQLTPDELRLTRAIVKDPPPATSEYGQWSDQVIAWFGTPGGVERRFYRWSSLPKGLRSLIERNAPRMMHRKP